MIDIRKLKQILSLVNEIQENLEKFGFNCKCCGISGLNWNPKLRPEITNTWTAGYTFSSPKQTANSHSGTNTRMLTANGVLGSYFSSFHYRCVCECSQGWSQVVILNDSVTWFAWISMTCVFIVPDIAETVAVICKIVQIWKRFSVQIFCYQKFYRPESFNYM